MTGATVDEQRLQEIESRADLATKGVWLHTFDQDNHELGNVWGPDGDAIAERVHGNLALGGDGIDNAAFIAHAREDIPALLAEVRRLRQEAEGQPVLKTEWQQLIAERDAALAEVSQIRAERDADRKALTCLKHDFNTAFVDNAEKQDEIASLTAALTEARRVLRAVEWVSQHGKITGPSIPEWAWCPCCGKTRQDDHTPADCALAAVLAQEEK